MKFNVPINKNDKVLYKGDGVATKEGNKLIIEGEFDWIVIESTKPHYIPIPGQKAGPIFERESKLKQYGIWVEKCIVSSRTYLKMACRFFQEVDPDMVDSLIFSVETQKPETAKESLKELARLFGVEINLKDKTRTQRLRSVTEIAKDVSKMLENTEDKSYPLILPRGKPRWNKEEIGDYKTLD